MDPFEDETRQFGRQSRPSPRPRQHFPDPAQAEYREYREYTDPSQYSAQPEWEEPAYYTQSQPDPSPRSNTAAIALGVIAALATLAALLFLMLWRGAAQEANQPPETVTVTQTQTETTTATTTRLPDLPTSLPTLLPDAPELPSELPPEIENLGEDVGGWLDSLLNEAAENGAVENGAVEGAQ